MTYPLDRYHSLLKHNFAAFAAKFFSIAHPHDSYDHTWHLDAFKAVIDQLERGKIRLQTISLPPRSSKSYFFSVAWPAFLLGHNPSEQIVCVSYSDKVIEELSTQTRKIMEHPLYSTLFPETVLERVTQRELRTTRGGKRFCTTIGGAMTGIGGNYFIVDDPINAIHAYSEPINKQVQTFFEKTLSSRANNSTTARFLIIMQRLHENDLIGHVQAQGGWTSLKLQARATEDAIIDLGKGRTHQVKEGDLLIPKRLPETELARLLSQQGSTMFEAQYQQNPLPATGNQIKFEWLKWYDEPMPREKGIIVQSWDTANKTDAANDWSACTTWLKTDQESQLIDVWRGKLAFPDLKKKVVDHYHWFGCSHLLIEDQASGQSLIQDLRASTPCNVIPRRHGTLSKAARVDQATGAIEGGRVVFPREAVWLAAYLHELLGVPGTAHDDQVDSTTQYILWLNERLQQGSFSYSFGDDEPLDAETIANHILNIRGFR